MIRTLSEMETEVRSHLHGGQGDVRIRHIFTREELKGHCRMFAVITLEPGASIGVHTHGEEEEIYTMLSGRAVVTDGEITREIRPGDAVLTGNGGTHSIRNDSGSPVEFMAVILLYTPS